jgi:hypothetical protein
MRFREMIAVYIENHKNPINRKYAALYIVKDSWDI